MLKKSWIILLAVLVFAASFAAAEESADSAVKITVTDAGPEAEADGVSFYEGVITIFKPGTYELSGSMTDGQIYVNCADEGKVTLILNGVSVSSGTSAALQIGKCKPGVELILAEGTENVIACGPDAIPDPNDDPNSALFSRSDLSIGGTGSLLVRAESGSGIASKDDLVILGGNITVQAKDHGLKGKDCVEIYDGILDITAEKDGIKSTNKDSSERGYVAIHGGTISIVTGDEPIQAVTGITVENAKITIKINKKDQ